MNFDQSLVEEFETVLKSPPPVGRQKEQFVQDFMEDRSELIPVTNLLGHHLHFGMIISKYKLSTEYTTDYIYITKNSGLWRIIFVELEKPEKLIFTGNVERVTTSAEFNAALGQVNCWRQFTQDHREEALRRLRPLLDIGNMRNNPIELKFQLIIGRSKNKNSTLARKIYLKANYSDVEVITYDQVIDYYKNFSSVKKNVMQMSGDKFSFKILNTEPQHIFSYMSPEFLQIPSDDECKLKAMGFEIDEWKRGKMLMINGKSTLPSHL